MKSPSVLGFGLIALNMWLTLPHLNNIFKKCMRRASYAHDYCSVLGQLSTGKYGVGATMVPADPPPTSVSRPTMDPTTELDTSITRMSQTHLEVDRIGGVFSNH